jgi:hypothetical protein
LIDVRENGTAARRGQSRKIIGRRPTAVIGLDAGRAQRFFMQLAHRDIASDEVDRSFLKAASQFLALLTQNENSN